MRDACTARGPSRQNNYKKALEKKWEERGAVGETPLHLALLYNEKDTHDWLVNELWDKKTELRTLKYDSKKSSKEGQTAPVYDGENVSSPPVWREGVRSRVHLILCREPIL
jgi:hypothetical protein